MIYLPRYLFFSLQLNCRYQDRLGWPWSSFSPSNVECGDLSPHGSESGDESPHSTNSPVGLNDDQGPRFLKPSRSVNDSNVNLAWDLE